MILGGSVLLLLGQSTRINVDIDIAETDLSDCMEMIRWATAHGERINTEPIRELIHRERQNVECSDRKHTRLTELEDHLPN